VTLGRRHDMCVCRVSKQDAAKGNWQRLRVMQFGTVLPVERKNLHRRWPFGKGVKCGRRRQMVRPQ
jgi:hypothetical protein